MLAGQVIHLVNTDPPYNVKVEPRSNNAIAARLSSFPATKQGAIDAAPNFVDKRGGMHHQGFDLARDKTKSKPTTKKLRPKDRPLANDFVSDEAFDGLLDAWFGVPLLDHFGRCLSLALLPERLTLFQDRLSLPQRQLPIRQCPVVGRL